MSKKLIIYLQNNAIEMTMDWVLVGDNDLVISNHHQLTLTQAANQAQQIIALVPGVDVFLTQAKLPKLSPARLAKALPYALEDQLTEEASTLHFATSALNKDKPLPVAIVSKKNMDDWLRFLKNELKENNSKLMAMIPDVLLLPWQPSSFYIYANEQLALVRTNEKLGFAIENDQLFTVLELMLKKSAIKPNFIQVSTSASLFSSEQIKKLDIPIQMVPVPTSFLGLVAAGIKEPFVFNLLQGAYASKQKEISIEQLMRAGFIITIACLFLWTLADLAAYIILQYERNVLQNESQRIFVELYPKQSYSRENAYSMIMKELNTLRASHARNAFLRLAKQAELVYSSLSSSGLILKTANYQHNQLKLEVEVNDLTLLDKLRQSLAAQDVNVTITNEVRTKEGLIQANIIMEEK